MKNTLAIVILTLALGACAASGNTVSGSGNQDAPPPAVRITQGPIVEYVTDTMAVIAWSTNVSSGSLVRYGLDPKRLDRQASMPWGALTHRVELKDLNPGATYYFIAESNQGQGTGTQVQAGEQSFQTATR